MNLAHAAQARSINSAMENSINRVNVAVGVIRRPTATHISGTFEYFVCKRSAQQHQGNKWEFPGGKVDIGETVDEALFRELKEEIGITVTQSSPLLTIDFDYSDKQVSLNVCLVNEFLNEAHGAEGQESKWVSYNELLALDFPAANKPILDALANL